MNFLDKESAIDPIHADFSKAYNAVPCGKLLNEKDGD